MYLKSIFQISIIAFILFAFSFQSCQKFQYKDEVRKTDSLLHQLEQAKETLVIDETGIRERYDSINSVLSFIDNYYQGEMSLEDQYTLTNFRAVGRAYRSYLHDYDPIVIENEAHYERINNLRKDLLAGRVSKTEFNEIYKNEKPLISAHKFKVKENTGIIVSVEPTYQRTKERSHEIYQETLKMKNQAQN